MRRRLFDDFITGRSCSSFFRERVEKRTDCFVSIFNRGVSGGCTGTQPENRKVNSHRVGSEGFTGAREWNFARRFRKLSVNFSINGSVQNCGHFCGIVAKSITFVD